MIESANEDGKTPADLFKDLLERLTSEEKKTVWNASETIQIFIKENSKFRNDSKTFNIKDLDSKDKYTTSLIKIIWLANTTNWHIKGFGSFLVKSLNVMKSWKCGLTYDQYLNVVNEKFMISSHNLSLPEIAYLFTLNDLQRLSKDDISFKNSHLNKYLGPPSLDKENYLPASFHDCFLVISNITSQPKKTLQFTYNTLTSNVIGTSDSPCSGIDKYPQCHEYCKWHEMFSSYKYNNIYDFMTQMTFALPQRKLMLDQTDNEKKLAQALSKSIKDLNAKTAPVSLPLFCHLNGKGMIGDKMEGLSERVCGNEFFPTPSDVGICQTKDLNLKHIAHLDNKYISLFLHESHKPKRKIKEGSLYSESTIVILNEYSSPDRQSYPRSKNLLLNKLKLQIHSPRSFAKLNKGKEYIQSAAAIELD